MLRRRHENVGVHMAGGVLTKAQRLEMQEVGKLALAQLTKHQPTYAATMAGAAIGGQIWAVLEALFEELEKAAQTLPNEFDLHAIEVDTLARVDSTASTYLATDLYRPRAGWSWSAKKRAFKRERQDTMDRKAMMAFLYLTQAHIYRDFLQSRNKVENS